MIRCMIIDYEPLAIDLIQDYVSKTEGFELAGIFTNPIDALHKIDQLNVDIIFLDVQMPELSGIQFLKIKKGSCHFVMTTAYEEYALEGFEHDVVDYLLKPISLERFMIAADRIKKRLSKESINSVSSLTSNSEYIFVKSEYKTLKINLAEIKYLEGLSDYIQIHLEDKKILTLDTLKNFTGRLPSNNFTRVHKSFVINMDQIDHIERNQIIIGDKRIPIGGKYLKNFQERLNK